MNARPAMSDERLEQIRYDLGSGFVYAAGMPKSAHLHVARELLDEVERLRGGLEPLRIEWSTDNLYTDPGSDREVLDFEFALDRVAKYPAIHRQLLSRQVFAEPWRASGGAIPDRMPSRADVEADGRMHARWSDVRAARMDSPEAQAGYEKAATDHEKETEA